MCVSVGLRTVTAPRVGLLTEEFIRRPDLYEEGNYVSQKPI